MSVRLKQSDSKDSSAAIAAVATSCGGGSVAAIATATDASPPVGTFFRMPLLPPERTLMSVDPLEDLGPAFRQGNLPVLTDAQLRELLATNPPLETPTPTATSKTTATARGVRRETPSVRTDGSVSIEVVPTPAGLRDRILGSGQRMRSLPTFGMLGVALVHLAGTVLSLFGASLLVDEASLVRTFGITIRAVEGGVYGAGYNGWIWVASGYLLTGLADATAAFVGATITWGGLRSSSTPSPVPDTVRQWLAASPELVLMPHGWRYLGLAIGDLFIWMGAAAVRLSVYAHDAHDAAPFYECVDPATNQAMMHSPANLSSTPWPGFERTYLGRLHGAETALTILFVGAAWRIGVVLVLALAWERLNVLYVLPWCRCNTEVFENQPVSQPWEGDVRAADEAEQARDIELADAWRVLRERYTILIGIRFRHAKRTTGSEYVQDAVYKPNPFDVSQESTGLVGGDDVRSFRDGLIDFTSSVQKINQLTNDGSSQLSQLAFETPQVAGANRYDALPSDVTGTSESTFAWMDAAIHAMNNDTVLVAQQLPARIQVAGYYSGPKVTPQNLPLRNACSCCGRTCGQGCCSGFASLCHNYTGAFRMWSYLATLFLLLFVTSSASSGVYGGMSSVLSAGGGLHTTIDGDFTWPVFVPDEGVYSDASVHPGQFAVALDFGPHHPNHVGGSDASPETPAGTALGATNEAAGLSPPSPPHSPPPSPPPLATSFPGPTCLQQSTVTGRTQPFPPGIDRRSDSSSYMVQAASFLAISELLRTVGSLMHLLGVLFNEAAVPGSHVEAASGAGRWIRLLFP